MRILILTCCLIYCLFIVWHFSLQPQTSFCKTVSVCMSTNTSIRSIKPSTSGCLLLTRKVHVWLLSYVRCLINSKWNATLLFLKFIIELIVLFSLTHREYTFRLFLRFSVASSVECTHTGIYSIPFWTFAILLLSKLLLSFILYCFGFTTLFFFPLFFSLRATIIYTLRWARRWKMPRLVTIAEGELHWYIVQYRVDFMLPQVLRRMTWAKMLSLQGGKINEELNDSAWHMNLKDL